MRKKQLEPGYEAAKEKALRLLEFRAHSEWELRRKLADAGAAQEDIEHVADFVREYHLVDDEAYAERLAADLANLKKFGKHRISAELSRRGIDRDMWDEVLDAAPRDDSKIDKFISSRLTDPEDRDQVRKVSAALFRRGYSWEDIREALNRFNATIED